MQIFSGEKLVNERGKQVKLQWSTENGEKIVLVQDMEMTLAMYKIAAAVGHIEAAFHAALTLLEPQGASIKTCKVCLAFPPGVSCCIQRFAVLVQQGVGALS